MYLKALEINTEKLGSNHISIADTFNNLASIYYAQGKYNKAEEFYLKSLKIKIEKLGSNHTSVADTCN